VIIFPLLSIDGCPETLHTRLNRADTKEGVHIWQHKKRQGDAIMEDPSSSEASSVSPEHSSGSLPLKTRRQFMIYAGVAAGGLAVGGAVGAVLTRIFSTGQSQTLAPYPQVYIANLSSLQTGKPLAFDYPLKEQSNYLIKLGKSAIDGVGPQGDVVAFSTTCVHMGCPLIGRYQDAHKILGPCPCHLSAYDFALGGMPVTGANTENLPQIELSVDERGNISAKGVWGVIYGFESNLQPGIPVKD
jgi:arsenite oxidase small subunit